MNDPTQHIQQMMDSDVNMKSLNITFRLLAEN
jgi:hypothetical protein